jgi:DNA-binding transcriptional LysR family regulator
MTLSEGVPAALTESLMTGDLDIAIMAKPTEKDERLRIEPIYRERFVVAFPRPSLRPHERGQDQRLRGRIRWRRRA